MSGWRECIAGTSTPTNLLTSIIVRVVQLVCIVDLAWLVLVKGKLMEILYGEGAAAANSHRDPSLPPLVDWKREFFVRFIYFGHGVAECVERVVVGAPKEHTTIVRPDALWDGSRTIEEADTIECINMGPYNYLGYAGRSFALDARDIPRVSTCASVGEGGVSSEQVLLQEELATFLGKEAALVLPMGWDTNVSILPLLIDSRTLVMSDRKNHSSLACGCKLGRAGRVVTFRNNDHRHLEELLLAELYGGSAAATAAAYNKILIIVEGVYSMDGTMIDVKAFVRLKKKYNAYLYVDEAHSIGAVGRNGRGVCYRGAHDLAKDVDVLMGTFTKSFSSIGGYVAASREVIDAVTARNTATLYGTCLSATCAHQVRRVLRELQQDGGGEQRVKRLEENTLYLRDKLRERGMVAIGDETSPVVPILTYTISRMSFVSRYCFRHGIAVVCAGHPATSLYTARIRLCVSAAHSTEQLDDVVQVLEEAFQLSYGNLREIYRL